MVEPSNWCLRSVDWWRRHWEGTGILDVEVADTMPEGRRLWLDRQRAVAPDNATEIATLEAEAGRFLADVRAVVRRTELRLERPVVSIPPRAAIHGASDAAPDPVRLVAVSALAAVIVRFSPRARASSAPGGGRTALSAGVYSSAPRVEGLRSVLSSGEDRTVTRGDLVIDRRAWPRGAESGDVVCQYIAGIGLRPEDTFGVMPSGANSRDLLFVYRDRPEYAAARQAGASGGATTEGMTGAGGPVPAEVSEMLAGMGIDLAGYGVNVEQRGERAPTVAPAAGTIVIHGLQWPGTSFLDHWRPPRRPSTSTAS